MCCAWLVSMALHVHCSLGQLSPLPTSGDDEWVAAKHCGRAKRSRISDTHRLRSSLQFRYKNNQCLYFLLYFSDTVDLLENWKFLWLNMKQKSCIKHWTNLSVLPYESVLTFDAGEKQWCGTYPPSIQKSMWTVMRHEIRGHGRDRARSYVDHELEFCFTN